MKEALTNKFGTRVYIQLFKSGSYRIIDRTVKRRSHKKHNPNFWLRDRNKFVYTGIMTLSKQDLLSKHKIFISKEHAIFD